MVLEVFGQEGLCLYLYFVLACICILCLYLFLHFASVFATMVFKWPSQTITVLTDILHNLIHSAAKFGFYLGISDAPSNANF